MSTMKTKTNSSRSWPEEGDEVMAGDIRLTCRKVEKNRVERVELYGEKDGEEPSGDEA